MNTSLYSANRNTHIKIVGVALVASIVLVVAGIHTRVAVSDSSASLQSNGPVVRAGQPAIYSTRDETEIR